jgi:hypothetical protein
MSGANFFKGLLVEPRHGVVLAEGCPLADLSELKMFFYLMDVVFPTLLRLIGKKYYKPI